MYGHGSTHLTPDDHFSRWNVEAIATSSPDSASNDLKTIIHPRLFLFVFRQAYVRFSSAEPADQIIQESADALHS